MHTSFCSLTERRFSFLKRLVALYSDFDKAAFKELITTSGTGKSSFVRLLNWKNALILEGDESPYVNVVAAKKNKDNEAINTLVDVLHSDEIQNFIKEEFNGAVVPVEGKSE